MIRASLGGRNHCQHPRRILRSTARRSLVCFAFTRLLNFTQNNIPNLEVKREYF